MGVAHMLRPNQGIDESTLMWGRLLAVLRCAADRSTSEGILDEEVFCRHPREEAPRAVDALKVQEALNDDESFLVCALLDSAEPGEDYGSLYEPLSEADQEAVRRISYRFDPHLVSLAQAAQALGVSEQRALQYAAEGSLEVFANGSDVRVTERSVKAFLQKQSSRTTRSFSRYSSRYE